MKISKIMVAACSVMLLAIGCSNVKDASESNFKKAAQEYLDTAYPTSYITVQFPYVPKDNMDTRTDKIMEQMEKAGLVKQTEITRKKQTIFMSANNETETVQGYELTDEGKKYYKADVEQSVMGQPRGGFSFGKAKVEKVENFTEPADLMGMKVSKVTYTYTVSDIPEWATKKELLELNQKLKTDVLSKEKPVQRADGFVLTEKGWIHEKMMRNTMR